MIQGVSSGSSSGILGRLVATLLSKELGRSIVVENMAGAGGTLGMSVASKAAPDGYTLVMLTQAQAVSETLYDKLSYRLMEDFQPITQIATGFYILAIHPSLPAKTMKEFIALAKSKPGQMNYGSSGNGTGTHLAAALFTAKGGLEVTHIPYKGTSPGLVDFLAGKVQMYVLAVPSSKPLIKAGKIRAIGMTASKRSSDFPDLPAIAEVFPGYEMTNWQGIAAPTGTPRPIIDTVRNATIRALSSPEAREKFEELGADIETSTPEQFRAYIKSQVAVFGEAIKASGAKVD